MAISQDTVLAVLADSDEILYRIQKSDKRIVYIIVLDPNIIPYDKRTYGPSAIEELSKLEVWNDPWTTLTVNSDSYGIFCHKDSMEPHAAPKESLLQDYPRCDLSNLSILQELKSRTFEVTHNQGCSIFKMARFPHELPWLMQEMHIYHALAGFPLTPKLLGYVFESHCPDRIVGILLEKLNGRWAQSEDLEECDNALQRLHQHVLHGDLNKHNIIITSEGPKFIDLESSVLSGPDNVELRKQERQKLGTKLADTSGEGRPW
ncbi:hypothetical protein G6O67_003425 [Ophiocordyceps sinensis]|uniref:Protein kinase-like domain protein n=2 Tax=Ophiocordyceps sinensis TaxID=72228 RepID=A0A8H4PWF6_9HYPO|nr:Protein kinase-like domain protein [Ophiocordyceps sinensis CO18]KAF4511650.1 hypothetical protein G6O67_003425 [Ophiocordyceps sinensis]